MTFYIKPNRFRFHRSISFYYELSSCDIYIISAVKNSSIHLSDIVKISFGLSYEYQTVKISSSSLQEQVVFVSISTLIHHFVLFLLEAFRLSLIGNVVLKVLLTGIFTIIFSVLIINLFKTSKK